MGDDACYIDEKGGNLPYQDTFDNGGTDINEPLASARYKNSTNYRNDSVSTEKSHNEKEKRKPRHFRNISHQSFSSDNSQNDRGSYDSFNDLENHSKALMKHSQSVLQFKDRNKVQKKILRLEIDPYDCNNTEVNTHRNSYVATSRSKMISSCDKENDERVINNLKTAKRQYQSKMNIHEEKVVTPRNMKYPPKQPFGASATNKS
jgi:hypothetical protein